MRLVDWVISCSLEINSGCLRYLAESQVRGGLAISVEPDDVGIDAQAIYTESLLSRDSRRILSLWQLIQPAAIVGDEATDEATTDEATVDDQAMAVAVASHIDALTEAVARLTETSAPLRLAIRLANQAVEDEQANLMLMLARALKPRPLPGQDWITLNELFAADSAFWREGAYFATVDDVLLCKRLSQSYRKGYKIVAKVSSADWSDRPPNEDTLLKLERLTGLCQLASHNMELLRGVLSEKQKHQLWYLDKLCSALRMRHGLRELIEKSEDVDLPKKSVKRARTYLVSHERKVNKRIDRLFTGAFGAKPKKFSRQLEQALNRLGLSTVSTVAQTRIARAEANELADGPQDETICSAETETALVKT
ncbi:MAG: hypothetical protein P8L31_06410 [Pseudomonadales bacterium]|nr:hypothetical protein [Pseudomonadales bacterium]